MDSLNGKLALVTGASQGLGRVIAIELAREGCIVVVNYSSNTENATRVLGEIHENGGDAFIERCDVSDEDAVNMLFNRLKRERGGVDILINNARLDPWRRKEHTSEGDWFDQVIAVNLKGAFLCSKAFFDNAKDKGWGRIINMSSTRAFRPAEEHMIVYGISKAGMHALTRSYAENGAPYGITANTVAPGMIITENYFKRVDEAKYAEETKAVPLGRGATCEEVADAVIFPLKNAYVNGETININGGMYYAP